MQSENQPAKRKGISRQALLAIGLSCIAGWAFTYLATNFFADYAIGLFILLPFLLGAAPTLIYSYESTVKKKLWVVSFNTLIVYSCGLLFFALEGIICLAMAFPIGLFFTWVGHEFAYALVKRKTGNTPTMIIILFIAVPVYMAFEDANPGKEKLRSVTSAIEINASPEQVWENVVAFPQLPKPTEFIFKTGIAYPINATIDGKGVGAIRLCNFSTGSFVEPITVWDEPKLLKFSVKEQPVPMKELSFYDVNPNHLHGYWVSKEGQFKLTAMSNGHTLLEGTTWYVNKIKPGFYWSLWSDHIVHKIHHRVLKYIKTQTETGN